MKPLRSPKNTLFTKSYLVDGPLMLGPERRMAMALNMGAELLEKDAFRDRADAIRALHAAGYPVVDVMILVEDAMQIAMQAIVEVHMSEEP